MKLFEPSPERVTLYFCKQCEKQIVAGNYAPANCDHCDGDEFWSEFDDGAPCNREDEEDDDEYFYDGEYEFKLRRAS